MGKHVYCSRCGSPMVKALDTRRYGYNRATGERDVKRSVEWVCGRPLKGVQQVQAGDVIEREEHDGWNYKMGTVEQIYEAKE